jgi:hypothetical protein
MDAVKKLSDEELKKMNEKLPAWARWNANEQLEVETREGKFVLEDKKYALMMTMRNNPGIAGMEELALISRMLVSPTGIGEMALKEMRTSTVMRLVKALDFLAGIGDSFL